MREFYIIKNGKRLRCGYTTGSCAAAAAKAAAMMLHSGTIPESVEIDTPSGRTLRLSVHDAQCDGVHASCCITKDAGDDPDITNGMKIFAQVSARSDGEIVIDGGAGIGRITREGFWGSVGAAAINPVPRRMIRQETASVAEHGWNILIYAPQGEEIAKKTFNSNLGIEHGISIIGTSGIVEPMSEDALKKIIYLRIDELYQNGEREILLFLGNYGERMLLSLGLDLPRVKISNFIGETILYCHHQGFTKITLIGHIGKLCKLSIGVFNTHSNVCDVRIEAFVYYLALAGAPAALLREVNRCASSEEVVQLMFDNGYTHIFHEMRRGCITRIKKYIKDEHFDIDVILYSMKHGIIGETR